MRAETIEAAWKAMDLSREAFFLRIGGYIARHPEATTLDAVEAELDQLMLDLADRRIREAEAHASQIEKFRVALRDGPPWKQRGLYPPITPPKSPPGSGDNFS